MTTLNLQQAAKYLKMHPITLLHKIHAGIVPAAKPAKRWVLIESDLNAYLQSLYITRSQQTNEPHLKPIGDFLPQTLAKKDYYTLLGIHDYPQIHSPKPDPRSGASHAHEANQVAESEAVWLVGNSGHVAQSNTRMV
jgi:hypothetical protein